MAFIKKLIYKYIGKLPYLLMVINPFVKLNKLSFTYDDELVEIDIDNFNLYFSTIIIIAKNSKKPTPTNIYNKEITNDEYNFIKDNYILKIVSSKILKNIKHFENCVILSREQLEPFNKNDIQLKEINIVLPILNIYIDDLMPYIEQYQKINTFDNVVRLLTLNKYYNIDIESFHANKHYEKLISTMDEATFWSMPLNYLNITKNFNTRKFNVITMRLDNETKKNIMNTNYLESINEKVLSEKNYRFYKTTKSQYTNNEINELLSILDPKSFHLTVFNLLASKKYCHHIINNYEFLDKYKNFIEDNKKLFKYILSYVWLRFYIDEKVKKSRITKNDEVVFDINTASKLPVFSFIHNQYNYNPYHSLTVSYGILKPDENVCGVSNNKKEIFSNLDEFKYRMNIFTNGNPDISIFDGIDFKEYDCAITGSIMPACIQKYHPLIDNFKGNTFEHRFNSYLDEYYKDSDIDIVFKTNKDTNDYIDFIAKSKKLYEAVSNNVVKQNNKATLDDIKLGQIKTCAVIINMDDIKKYISIDNIKEIENKDSISEKEYYSYIKKNINEENYKRLLSNFIDNLKNKEKNIDEEPENILNIYIGNNESRVSYSYKFKIYSKFIKHNLELFQIKYNDFFSGVHRFHLPIVRSYYDGTNVYMLPSCITAHMTYMNIDYNYFAGSRDPINIINKYRQRGFGTWLTSKEIKTLISYSANVSPWKELYDINMKDQTTINKSLGILGLNHKLFYPSLFSANENKNIDNRYVSNRPDNKIENDVIESKLPIPDCVIDINGNIKPLNNWLISASYYIKNNIKINKKNIIRKIEV